MRKVKNDSEFVALYVSLSRNVFQNNDGVWISIPSDQELHVYRDDETLSIDFRDEWGNKYYVIEGDGLKDFTRMGVQIFTTTSTETQNKHHPSQQYRMNQDTTHLHQGLGLKRYLHLGNLMGVKIQKWGVQVILQEYQNQQCHLTKIGLNQEWVIPGDLL